MPRKKLKERNFIDPASYMTNNMDFNLNVWTHQINDYNAITFLQIKLGNIDRMSDWVAINEYNESPEIVTTV